jgi:hypothetical protein
MDNKMNDQKKVRLERRAFFGRLFAAIGGGVLTGSVLNRLLNTGKEDSTPGRHVSITANPMAVPRSKEGSKSNV